MGPSGLRNARVGQVAGQPTERDLHGLETPQHLGSRLPEGSYRIDALERSAFVFGRVVLSAGKEPLEAGIVPEADILSVHLSPIKVEARRDGKLIYNGPVACDAVSLAECGCRSEVVATGDIDIVQLFLPKNRLSQLSAEIYGRPINIRFTGFVQDAELTALARHAAELASSCDPAERLQADITTLWAAARTLQIFGDVTARYSGKAKQGGLSPWRLKRAIEFLDDNVGNEITLAGLARLVDLSPYHFLRSFKASTGLTPQDWLMQRRIARIKERLGGKDYDHLDAAYASGYSSRSAMSAAFRRVTGVTPTEWRRALR